MYDQRLTKTLPAMTFLIAGMWIVSGCQTSDHFVIASTGTVIGIEVSQNPANQKPQAKLGYNRSELAIVPTNRGNCESKQMVPSSALIRKVPAGQRTRPMF